MATYTNVTIEQMREILRVDKGWKETHEPKTKETVFYCPLVRYPFVHLKVYTGIVEGQSRGVGKDAIRVCSVNMKYKSGWIKAKRVHRVEGWRDNLKKRVVQVITDSHGRFQYPKSK